MGEDTAVEFPILLLIIAASLTLCYNLWPSLGRQESQPKSLRVGRPRFQERMHIYIPSAANTLGILLISIMSGSVVPFALGLTGYFLLATLFFVEFVQS